MILLRRQFCGIAWSPDGKTLALVDRESPQASSSIYLLDIDTREKRKLTEPPPGGSDGLSAFSPDGRNLAFVRSPGGFPSDIYIMPLSGGGQPAVEPRRLTQDLTFICGLDWSADGRRLIFSSMRGGASALWSVAASGGEPERLPVGGSNALLPSVSRRGDRLAYNPSIADWNIWRAALPQGEASGGTEAPARLIFSREEDFQPSISPDGKRVVFSSRRSGNFEIWICNSDGSSAVQVTHINGGLGDPSWSPDSREIVFYGADTPGKQHHIRKVNVEGGTARRVTTGDFQEVRPSWSRNGKWIYFSSDRGTGMQVWKVPAEGGTPTQLTRNGGFRARESIDGKSVYFWRAGSIWRMAVEGGEETQVLPLGVRTIWTIAASGFYLLDPEVKTAPAIELFRFDTQVRTLVLKLPGEPGDYVWEVGSFAVSPDERWILYEHRDQRETDIILVENFR
jgi:Tol biopolymer transport system component